jgi:UDP-glucose 4-epimerase
MGGRILVTGSAGLIGAALSPALAAAGYQVVPFDLRGTGPGWGDVRNPVAVSAAVEGCRGVVHLAAVSRVLAAERDPAACWETNVVGLDHVLRAALAQRARPWVISASSREVYGNPARLPADETSPLQPINTYAHSKVAGELRVRDAVAAGLRAITVRFSNVFGSADDYPDRVVPAFAWAAATGGVLRVRGPSQRLDFTCLDDVTAGVLRLARVMDAGAAIPDAVHLVGERALSLEELAAMAVGMGSAGCRVVAEPGTGVHVSQFLGCGRRARQLLGWTPRISVEAGLARLIADLQGVRPPRERGSNASYCTVFDAGAEGAPSLPALS